MSENARLENVAQTLREEETRLLAVVSELKSQLRNAESDAKRVQDALKALGAKPASGKAAKPAKPAASKRSNGLIAFKP